MTTAKTSALLRRMTQTASVPSQHSGTESFPQKIGVKLLPREIASEHHPGHMGVTWTYRGKREFRGFRFDILELPKPMRLASKWRAYLFEHTVPGYVVNDTNLQDAVNKFGRDVLCKQWETDDAKIIAIADRSIPGPCGSYSFAPDRHVGCNNCVTWAINTVNAVLGPVLPTLPTGRIKLAIEMLRELGAVPSA